MSGLRAFTRMCVLTAVIFAPPFAIGEGREKKSKPLFRDFIGLNVHTVQFKSELYKPVTRLLRDYHGFKERAERMPVSAGAAQSVNWTKRGPEEIELDISESRVYLWLRSG
jgi:hypothetical protein